MVDDAEVERQLDAIVKDGVNLTTWEAAFVEDMQARIEEGRSLTEKQAAVVERIYAERTP